MAAERTQMKLLPFHRSFIREDLIESVGFGMARTDGTLPVVVQMESGAHYCTDPLALDDATVEIRRILRALGEARMPPAPKVVLPASEVPV